MTNSLSHLPDEAGYSTVKWHQSTTTPEVRFAVRRISLGARIDLMKRIRELTLRNEFLKAGDAADRLEASLSEMLVQELLVNWGLTAITGLMIDGNAATRDDVVDKAPEDLADEIARAVWQEADLTEDERKNF